MKNLGLGIQELSELKKMTIFMLIKQKLFTKLLQQENTTSFPDPEDLENHC